MAVSLSSLDPRNLPVPQFAKNAAGTIKTKSNQVVKAVTEVDPRKTGEFKSVDCSQTRKVMDAIEVRQLEGGFTNAIVTRGQASFGVMGAGAYDAATHGLQGTYQVPLALVKGMSRGVGLTKDGSSFSADIKEAWQHLSRMVRSTILAASGVFGIAAPGIVQYADDKTGATEVWNKYTAANVRQAADAWKAKAVVAKEKIQSSKYAKPAAYGGAAIAVATAGYMAHGYFTASPEEVVAEAADKLADESENLSDVAGQMAGRGEDLSEAAKMMADNVEDISEAADNFVDNSEELSQAANTMADTAEKIETAVKPESPLPQQIDKEAVKQNVTKLGESLKNTFDDQGGLVAQGIDVMSYVLQTGVDNIGTIFGSLVFGSIGILGLRKVFRKKAANPGNPGNPANPGNPGNQGVDPNAAPGGPANQGQGQHGVEN